MSKSKNCFIPMGESLIKYAKRRAIKRMERTADTPAYQEKKISKKKKKFQMFKRSKKKSGISQEDIIKMMNETTLVNSVSQSFANTVSKIIERENKGIS